MRPHMHFATLLLALAACESPVQQQSEPDPTMSNYAPLAAEAAKPVECTAIVSSRISQAISAESDGAVMALSVGVDQPVKAGDPIAQLDIAELRAALDKAGAQRDRARGQAGHAYAMASQAQRKAHLESRLVRTGASSPEAQHSAQSELDAASADGAAAGGDIRAAESTITETKRLIAAASLKSPIDGIVSVVKIRKGEVAHKGMTIAKVFDPTDLIVKFVLPKTKRSLIKEGQRVIMSYGTDKKVPVTVKEVVDDHDVAIDFLQVVAELDKTGRPDDIHVGVFGQVRLEDKGVTR
jgi:HlyD family secretion protein